MMIYGKALLVVQRNADVFEGRPHFDVYPYIQSAEGSEYAHDAAFEDLMVTEPPIATLAVGDSAVLQVSYTISYHRFMDGEVEAEGTFNKVRVLHRSRMGRNRKQRKQIKQQGKHSHVAVPF